jgi:hypothetical protein
MAVSTNPGQNVKWYSGLSPALPGRDTRAGIDGPEKALLTIVKKLSQRVGDPLNHSNSSVLVGCSGPMR